MLSFNQSGASRQNYSHSRLGFCAWLLPFSRALHQLHTFPRFAPVRYFPTLYCGCMFSRTLYQLHGYTSSLDWFIASYAFDLFGQNTFLHVFVCFVPFVFVYVALPIFNGNNSYYRIILILILQNSNLAAKIRKYDKRTSE